MNTKYKKILNIRKELYIKQKPLYSDKEIINWYFKIVKTSKVKVKKINLNDCQGWEFSKNLIKHKSNKFFKVEGIRVIKSFKREIENGWDQPILTEPSYKGGILGLMRKNINGFPHYLVNAKFEPGNYKLIQLSPTLQATFSNISRAHKGNSPKFLKYFTNPKKNKCEIIFKQWFSEEGGRLNQKRNYGILINNLSKENIILDDDFRWLTLKQIKSLILKNAIVNPHLRGLVSFI